MGKQNVLLVIENFFPSLRVIMEQKTLLYKLLVVIGNCIYVSCTLGHPLIE